MSNIHCSPISAPPVDFTVFHEIMRDHIHRGNDFAVLAALALNVVHEDPHFWHTCTYRSGIAAAVIGSSLNRSDKTHPQQESEVTTDDTSLSVEQEPLTASELYIILKRIGNDDKLLRRVIEQLEEVPASPNNEEDVLSSSPSGVELQVDLADLCTVLHERCRSCKVKKSGVLNVPPNVVIDTHSGTAKHLRLSDDSIERRVVHVCESTSNFGKKISEVQDVGNDGDMDAVGCSDALGVLARMPALPGSTRALTSFDAVGDSLDYKRSGQVDHINHRSRKGNQSVPESSKMGGTIPSETPLKQRRHKFTPEEDEAILRGVVRFAQGPGRFESIFHAYRDVWHPGRTSTQLYDHWRGTLRQRTILQQGGYRGKNSIATRGGPH
ncbi:TTAGGG binding factor [Trypanosoma theileri]|uniref:TTAGGG binding factor n=1 Tax=Trypanosoma theileri TaxID=67003 RepID=A0A1X0P8G2_9TRYP|nr:TTAGGG binding factor [Trypanosoma theileri]ORC92720.1 TTAGGG binding factor [Trypanosoma theileri]